jgi:hypothetical protein
LTQGPKGGVSKGRKFCRKCNFSLAGKKKNEWAGCPKCLAPFILEGLCRFCQYPHAGIYHIYFSQKTTIRILIEFISFFIAEDDDFCENCGKSLHDGVVGGGGGGGGNNDQNGGGGGNNGQNGGGQSGGGGQSSSVVIRQAFSQLSVRQVSSSS